MSLLDCFQFISRLVRLCSEPSDTLLASLIGLTLRRAYIQLCTWAPMVSVKYVCTDDYGNVRNNADAVYFYYSRDDCIVCCVKYKDKSFPVKRQ